ncbi:MAG: hypothetical protein ThorAB25_15120, partial [Candidatus Thorarchaeota archaeon AB_25]
MKFALTSLLFILILNFTASIDQSTIISREQSIENHPQKVHAIANYTTHSPILIESNSDFETQGWPGNGSASNPYVISGLNITSDVDCIQVRYTSVHFTIRDCFLSASDWKDCIDLQIVNTAFINSCIISTRFDGINLYSASNVVVQDCVIESARGPITALNSYGFQVINCTFPAGTLGSFPLRFWLETSNNAIIDGNEFHDVFITTVGSNFITLTSNNFTDGGLLLSGSGPSSFYEVSENWVNGKPLLYLEGNESLVIEADGYGQVVLMQCSNILVRDGNMSDTRPVQLIDCIGCTVENITAWRGSSGIYDYGSNYTTIRDCIFNGVGSAGVWMTRCGFSLVENCTSNPGDYIFERSWLIVQVCFDTIVTRCTIINHQDEALYFTGERMILTNCTIMGARYGVHVRGVNMTVDNNHIHSMSSENTHPFYSTGIHASSIKNSTISNNLIENGDDYGIFAMSNNSLFVNNTIVNNEGIGIELFNSSNGNSLYGNILKHNLLGNALDNGFDNQWDDGISIGNLWDDFNPHTHSQYEI